MPGGVRGITAPLTSRNLGPILETRLKDRDEELCETPTSAFLRRNDGMMCQCRYLRAGVGDAASEKTDLDVSLCGCSTSHLVWPP